MRPCGSFIKLYTPDSSKYAGIVTEPALLKLLTQHSVEINASMIAPETHSSKGKDKGQASMELSGLELTPTLRIVVYGAMRNRTNVGNLLSSAGLYFQHPSPRDVQHLDLDAEYFNPHYLVRPGCQMPRLEDLAIAGDDATPTTCLDEAAKGQLMGIFDMAGDLAIKPTTTPSPRALGCLTRRASLSCIVLKIERRPSTNQARMTSWYSEVALPS